MPRAACLMASRFFQDPCAHDARARCARHGSLPSNSYLGNGLPGAARQFSTPGPLRSRTLLIAAENEFHAPRKKRDLWAQRLMPSWSGARIAPRHAVRSVEGQTAARAAYGSPLPPSIDGCATLRRERSTFLAWGRGGVSISDSLIESSCCWNLARFLDGGCCLDCRISSPGKRFRSMLPELQKDADVLSGFRDFGLDHWPHS